MHTTSQFNRPARTAARGRWWLAAACMAALLTPAGALVWRARAQASGAERFQSALLLGKNAYRERRTDDAIRALEAAVELAGDSSVAHLWLGRAYVQAIPQASFIRQPVLARRARSQFDRALELDPQSVDAHEDRAIFYMYSPALFGGGMTNARAEAEVVRALDPYRGALVRGEIEAHDGNVAKAESEYIALMASHPDSAAPFNRLVTLYQTSGRYGEAFAAVDRRLAARRDDAWALYHLGRTAALSGERLEQGEAALRKFITASSGQPAASEASARYRLGMILEQRHDAGAARAEYDAAVRLDPRLEDAKRALKRVTP